MKQIKVKIMPYCPKCGTEVREEMAFCPKCGASLKVEKPPAEAAPAPPPRRAEKAEKHEKREKTEKHEKREFVVIGPLIAGLILIFLGSMVYLQAVGFFEREVASALFLIIIGIVIIVGALYAATIAARRHPEA